MNRSVCPSSYCSATRDAAGATISDPIHVEHICLTQWDTNSAYPFVAAVAGGVADCSSSQESAPLVDIRRRVTRDLAIEVRSSDRT